MRCPLITMSAITGKPKSEEIFSYMSSLKGVGIDEVMIYPRSGCEIEYLSEEWFLCVCHFIEAAKTLDMKIWLYDDFNWPSGDAGGRVTAIPEFRLQAISTKGESIGQISVKSRHNSGLFGEKYFPNLLSSDAVNYFIKCTHAEYFKRFGVDFGTVIKGMFTDEPSIGYCCHDDYIPYYDGLKDDYFSYSGRDFDTDMKNEHSEFYLNAITVISNRFKSCYLDIVAKWCKEHNILMTGHFMCDHNPISGVKHSGNTLKNLSTLSLPGIDEIYTGFDDICETSLFGMAEYASRQNGGAMAELFALGPSDMSYQKKRAMLYFAACHKIDNYFLAISHFDMRGNLLVKDYFNTFSVDQPDFIGVRELASEAKSASVLSKKDFVPDVCVRFPFAASAKNIASDVDTVPFLNVLNELTFNQVQWKYITDESPSAPIIELDSDFNITLNGEKYDISKIKCNPILTDMQGNAPKGVFVRRFEDKTFVAINLYSYDGEYLINGQKITLNKYDVYFSNVEKACEKAEVFSPVFKVTHNNENVARTMYLNGKKRAEIICKNDTEATIFVRNGVSGYLNGEKIVTKNNACELPSGMRCLYKKSAKLALKSGVNIIEAENDFKYMPSVLLSGDFSYKTVNGEVCALELNKRETRYRVGEKIYDFGSISYEATVEIPSGTKALKIHGTDFVASVYINGVCIGTKAFAPYVYDIPSSLGGKEATLKIVQLSSIAPIFGDVCFWDEEVKECGWRGTPAPEGKAFGFSKIEFII